MTHYFQSLAGIFGLLNPVRVTEAFALYVLVDMVWLIVQPEAVPSLPNVILIHHVVTMILLYFPIRYNELAIYTCWDGLCEINTFFLIARRQFKQVAHIMEVLYWVTFVLSRSILYPVLLFDMYQVMSNRVLEGAGMWQLVTVCLCQFFLICFNFALLYLGIRKARKKLISKKTA